MNGLPTVHTITDLGPGDVPALVVPAALARRYRHSWARGAVPSGYVPAGTWVGGFDGSRNGADPHVIWFDESQTFTTDYLRDFARHYAVRWTVDRPPHPPSPSAFLGPIHMSLAEAATKIPGGGLS